jgi:hypothetical protein
MASVRYVIDPLLVSVEKRRVAGRRRRARIDSERAETPVGQAGISLSMAAAMLFLLLMAFSFRATDQVAAVAIALQAGTVLLVSPEVLRPLRRLHYFNRPLAEIHANSRRNMRRGAIAFAVLLVFLAVSVFDVDGVDSGFIGAAVFLLALICACGVLGFIFLGVTDMLFEGAAESWTQKAVSRLGSEKTSEMRLLCAGAFFLGGILLLYWGAYS